MAKRQALELVSGGEDAVPLEDLIHNLKKDIETDCRLILQRAEVIRCAVRGKEFRFRFWENRVNEIKMAEITSYDADELKELRNQCMTITQELEEFSKKLS